MCKKDIISMYTEDVLFPVYCNSCFNSDSWDSMSYGADYDFSISFFDQYKKLSSMVPRLALEGYQNENSPFSNYTWVSKDIYLSPTTMYSENVVNSFFIVKSNNILDCSILNKSSFCYEVVNGESCSNVFFSLMVNNCLDSSFLFNCKNCTNCFMSSNLRNKTNVFRGVQLSSEEYKKEISKISLSNTKELILLKNEYEEMKKNSIHKFSHLEKVENVTGNNISNSKNLQKCFDSSECENVKHSVQIQYIKDSMDLFGAGDVGQFIYEGVNVGFGDSSLFFSSHSYDGMFNSFYTEYCHNSQNIFGCIGLKKKNYCILNKQYSKDEYENFIPSIIDHMNQMPYIDKIGNVYKYGEFFPSEFSPFAYNESIVSDYFNLSKLDAMNYGYLWKETNGREYHSTLSYENILESSFEISDSILDQIISCMHDGKCNDKCTKAFKIIPQELEFYRRFNISLPILCPSCRYNLRFSQKNPIHLWHRQCMCDKDNHNHEGRCEVEFETSYAPDRPEIVYCEKCYQQEVM